MSIPAKGLLTIEVGNDISSSRIEDSRYARHSVLVPRTSTQESPKGQGHYNNLTDSLIVATEDASGIGLSSVTFADVPDDSTYFIQADIKSSGLPLTSEDGVLLFRIDFLDGQDSLSTRYFVIEDYDGLERFEDISSWIGPVSEQEQEVSLSNGSTIQFPIGEMIPMNWPTADDGNRRILISLLLRGMGPITIETSLSDGYN